MSSSIPIPTPAQLERNKLAERWLWLVETIFSQEFRGRGDHDDLCSEGQFALMVTVGNARIDEGRRPGSYLSQAIRWAMQNEIRRAARRQEFDDEWAGHIVDPRGDPSSAVDLADLSAQVWVVTLLGALGPTEMRVVALTYGIDGGVPLTQDEIGRELGIGRRQVGRILRSALNRMGDADRTGSIRESLGIAS